MYHLDNIRVEPYKNEYTYYTINCNTYDVCWYSIVYYMHTMFKRRKESDTV